jgi:hypothetical protein
VGLKNILPFCETCQAQKSFCVLAQSHLLCRVAGSISFIMTIKPALPLFTSALIADSGGFTSPLLLTLHLPEAVSPDDRVLVSIIDLQVRCTVKESI